MEAVGEAANTIAAGIAQEIADLSGLRIDENRKARLDILPLLDR